MNNLPCKIHPNQKITNFCIRQQCLVQLCATCICHHTEMHNSNGTLPHYQNIVNTYKRATQSIDAQRNVIGNQSRKIVAFNQNWQRKRQILHQKILGAKKDVLQLVECTFAQLQQKLDKTINEEQMKMGMKFGDRVSKMLQAHKAQSDKLFNLQRQLIGPKGPETAKLLYSIAFPKSNQLLDKINNDFSLLQAHDVKLDYFQDQLLGLKQKINNLMSLEIKYPEAVIRQPLIQLIDTRPIVEVASPVYKTSSSSFYPRSQSAGKGLKNSVILVDGTTPVVENKPKISIVSNRFTQNMSGNTLLLKNSKRSSIFPGRPVSQFR